MKIKTSELTGKPLDWAVAKCEYDELAAKNIQYPQYAKHYPKVSPSTDWAQAGPIIEREEIGLLKVQTLDGAPKWAASSPYWFEPYIHGPTPLVAAMRCYVASKLGDEVDVPEELK